MSTIVANQDLLSKYQIVPSTPEKLEEDMNKVYAKYQDKKITKYEAQGSLKKGSHIKGSRAGNIISLNETEEHADFRMEVMKASLRNPVPLRSIGNPNFEKSAMSTASNLYGFDLYNPSLHLVPWLSPIRDMLPRRGRPMPGIAFNWKSIRPGTGTAGTFSRGGMPASPWVPEGQRAPQQTLSFANNSANYVTMGVEGAVTFQEEWASQNFEDALATGHFFALENLMLKEEDAIIGGNATLKIGTANTPTGTSTGTGSFTGNFYAACVGLTYEGYRNFFLLNGINTATTLTQQQAITTPDQKVMTVNSGCGQGSAISSVNALSSKVSGTFSVTPKNGEVAWLWYVGTANSAAQLFLQAITNVPSYTFTATPGTSTQAYSALVAADFSVNDGTTGGGVNQVKAFDGFLTQSINNASLSPANAYLKQFNGATLTSNGSGGIKEIDNMLLNLWNNYQTTLDVLYVNAQELKNITAGVLSNASGPLLRFDKDADSGKYDLTGGGTISFYHNPYIPGGKDLIIMVHPTLPPGTMFGYAKTLPPYFKTNSTPTVAEIITRKDYFSKDFADTTLEFQFGVYADEVLAVYAPFCLGVLTGIGDGIGT